MEISPPPSAPDLQADHRADEAALVRRATPLATLPAELLAAAQSRARKLVEALRAERTNAAGVDALMGAFPLGSPEGLAIMSLAEALLRIPDADTADALIRDKLGAGDWQAYAGHSPSLLVNAACWGLVVSGALARTGARRSGDANDAGALLARLAEPAVRSAMRAGIGFLGAQFVLGETIQAAIARAVEREAKGFRHSYDMLGEAALTAADADRYHALYRTAIEAVGSAAAGRGERDGPGVSIKLSALHPRYGRLQRDRVLAELTPRLVDLAGLARSQGIGITVDAEEADRLRLSLEVIEAAAMEKRLRDWAGFGIAIQAVQKRSLAVVDWALQLARRRGAPLMLRLVKGAYWDTEVKRAQVAGLDDYPVFTRKAHTDVSYLACARRLLEAGPLVFPQFATHNALTVCQVMAMAGAHRDFEFQCLHGMGESLYDHVVGDPEFGVACRIYAPVGTHETLLAYLVRRLLENGANASFVSQIVNPSLPVERLTADPVAFTRETQGRPHERVPKPSALFADRRNARGWDLADEGTLATLSRSLAALAARAFHAEPVLAHPGPATAPATPITNPGRRGEVVGTVRVASRAETDSALGAARAADGWRSTPPARRAALLDHAASLLEDRADTFVHLAIREAGKTLPNALGEVREAVDFCRFYAAQARTQQLGAPLGVVVAISPWNFPLAIFLGQVSAALAAGNAVLAKPAEQTPLIAAEVVRLLHEAGFPRDAVQLLPGPGETVGAALVADARVDGVMFTGSTAVAQHLHRTLAARGNLVLIAETGGQNALIVDSSALPEQAVADVIASAFDSAGQRCSALRVLCVQDDIADGVIPMLAGAMAELRVGDPAKLDTDVGPIIDADALDHLRARIDALGKAGRVLARTPLPIGLDGHYVAPIAIEVPSLASLGDEIFGPVLRVHRFAGSQLGAVIDAINAAGYGLTAGVHSRLDATIAAFLDRIRAGNLYVNRNLIGAVVGVQPFGGEGLSGTGPKAGGPWTLRALARSGDGDEPVEAFDKMSNAPLPPGLARREVVLNAIAARLGPESAPLLAHARAALVDGAERVLPGPTGERNTWHAGPRGLTVALGDESQSAEAWGAQAVSAIAAGNPITFAAKEVIHANAVAEIVRGAGWPAVTVRKISGDDWATIPDLAAVLAGTERMASDAARRVAALPGPRIPVVAPNGPAWRYDIWRLQCERAVSVNTAAAGGNATLLAEAS